MKAWKGLVLFGVIFSLVSFTFYPVTLKAEDSYPSKPIKWVVPYSPGGGYDVYSRAVAKYMPKHLPRKVPIVIINSAGAGERSGSPRYTTPSRTVTRLES